MIYSQGGAESRIIDGRLDHHIWVEIPQSHPRLQNKTRDGRDMWLYKTTLDLEDFDWGYDSNANWSPMQVSRSNMCTSSAIDFIFLSDFGRF